MYCKNCGKKIRDGAEFCSKCGCAVDGSIPIHEISKTVSIGTRSNIKIILLIIIIVVLFLTSVFLLFRSTNNIVDESEQKAKTENDIPQDTSESSLIIPSDSPLPLYNTPDTEEPSQNIPVSTPTQATDTDDFEFSPQTIDDIPASLIEKMKDTARAVVDDNVKNTWNSAENLDSMEFENVYLLSGSENISPQNYIGVVFKINVSVYLPDLKKTDRYDYYYSLVFKNAKRINGEWQIDLQDYSQPDSQVDFYPGSYHHFFYYGYKNWEDLKTKSINPFLDRYELSTYESFTVK